MLEPKSSSISLINLSNISGSLLELELKVGLELGLSVLNPYHHQKQSH